MHTKAFQPITLPLDDGAPLVVGYGGNCEGLSIEQVAAQMAEALGRLIELHHPEIAARARMGDVPPIDFVFLDDFGEGEGGDIDGDEQRPC